MTETGKVRQTNEDAVLETGNLFAVADGMGGHRAGEVASSLALGVVGQYIEDNIGLIPGEKLVEKAAAAANAAVCQKASSSAKYRQMGTTLTLLYREGDTAYVAHVGDSRAYLFREGDLRRLTRDHSLVATLVEEGEITEEQAMRHPQRNIILKALGLEPRVDVDVSAVRITPGDVFVVASDGLTGLVPDGAIEAALRESLDPVRWARRLADMALEAGGTDNVSVVVVQILESDTVVPVGGARALDEAGEGPPGPSTGAPGPRKGARRRLMLWLGAWVTVVVLLGAGFSVAFYFYNRTYWVGVKGGKVTLFRGFPFWGFATVQEQTDIQSSFLPETLRRRVENKLEPESRSEALKTIRVLEREAEKNTRLVPNVQDKEYSAAKKILEKTGLRVKQTFVSLTGVEVDKVIGQEPAPGTRVGKGTSVELKVVLPGSNAREV